MISGFDIGAVASLGKRIKGVFTWGIGVTTAILLGATSLQSIVASASDGAYLRAAKYAASSAIPIVGSAVSSVLGTLAGGFSYAKGAIGAASVFFAV